jgi:serine/threonine-protein kinase
MGELAPGSKISGRYRLERLVGEGGMGEVWVASHLVTRKVVALKVMKQERALKHEFVQRFFLEARAATAVQHPNVIQVHDVFYHRGSPVMVMDYLEGESLAEKLAREEKVPLAELASILVPVLSAVGTAHTLGIVHRDLKPENIFLSKNRALEIDPKVLDFGIAKLSHFDADAGEPAPLTRTGTMMGTLHYMSPEQASGEKGVDQGADVWAMGVILFECLAGRRPFAGDNFGQVFKAIVSSPFPKLSKLCPDLPADVEKLIARMLEKERIRRCTDLREPFEILSRHTTVVARPFGIPRSSMPAASPWGNGPAAPLGEPTDVDQFGPPSSVRPGNRDVTFLESVASHTPMPTARRTGTFVMVGVGVAVLGVGVAAAFASLGGFGVSTSPLNASSHGVRVPSVPPAPVTPVATESGAPQPEVVPRLPPSGVPVIAPAPAPAKPAHPTGAAVSNAAGSSARTGRRGGRPKHTASAVASASASVPAPPSPPDHLGLPDKPF